MSFLNEKQDLASAIDPVDMLKQIYLKRRKKNAQYSLTSFARDLGVSHVQVFRILNGSRNLTLKQASRIAVALHFGPSETDTFIRSVVMHTPKNAKISKTVRNAILSQGDGAQAELGQNGVLELERFRAIAHWYHFAIINLTYVKNFDPSPKKIAKALQISPIEARDAVERLLKLGLLEEKDGTLKPTSARLFVDSKRPDPATRVYETEMLEKAKLALSDFSDEGFANRAINGITFPCAKEHIPEIKKKLKKFQLEVLDLIRKGPFEEVYQLNSQLFPITKSKGENS